MANPYNPDQTSPRQPSEQPRNTTNVSKGKQPNQAKPFDKNQSSKKGKGKGDDNCGTC